ncbi:MAG: TolC family protein [Candidatus Eisenbacteria bacterium]
MRRAWFASTAAWLLLFAGGAGAAPSGAPVNPDEALTSLLIEALRSSPAIAASDETARGAHLAASAADRLPDPTVGLMVSPVAVETRGGPQRGRVSVEQAFPFFGKRGLRREAAESDARIQDERSRAVSADIILRTKEIFWDVYRIDRAIEIARIEERLLADIVSAARARYETGGGSQSGLLQAQLMRGRVQDRLLTFEGARRAAEQAIGGIAGTRAQIPPLAVLAFSPPSIDREALLDRARRASPETAAAEEAVRKARFSLDLAAKEFYPDFALSATWAEVGASDMPGEFNGRDSWTLGAMVKVPLFRGDARDRRDAAAASLRAAEEGLADRRARSEANAADAIERMEAAARSIEWHRGGLIPQAESAFRSSMAAYSTGELEFADLILAEKALLEVQLGFHEAIARHEQLVARIDRLVGSADERTLFTVRDAARSAAGPQQEE